MGMDFVNCSINKKGLSIAWRECEHSSSGGGALGSMV